MTNKRKTSKIWIVSKNDLQDMVNASKTRSEVLRKLELSTNGASNHNRLKMRFSQDNIDVSCLVGTNKGVHYKNSIPLKNILIANSNYQNRSSLKRRLLKENLLVNECYICKLKNWLGKSIVLQLDHINGVFNDHRIENIRLLCPNCHSQTQNFAGKNKINLVGC